MFLHVCVILFTVGGGGSPGRENPPRQGEPPRQGPDPPGQGEPPWQGPDTPQDQTTPPSPPPSHLEQTLPHKKQTPAYGLRAAGTHPTGMHSCCINCIVSIFLMYDLSRNQLHFFVWTKLLMVCFTCCSALTLSSLCLFTTLFVHLRAFIFWRTSESRGLLISVD